MARVMDWLFGHAWIMRSWLLLSFGAGMLLVIYAVVMPMTAACK